MQISEVLAVNRSYAPEHSQVDILGDGFLIQTNPVYRNIKISALNMGAKYLEAWPRYLLMPFHELGYIVSTKTIPYVPSGRLLQEVEDKRPNVFTSDELRMPESYHLHEGAHVIAEHLFEGVQLRSIQEKIFKAILCESFANSADALACMFATSPEHQFFIQQNSYMHPQKKYMDAVTRIEKGMGLRFSFLVTLFAYVQANFLREPLARNKIKELAQLVSPEVSLSEKMLKDCDLVGHMAEKLDPLFRLNTTQMYLKSEGIDGDILDIFDFQYMQLYARNMAFANVVQSMADILAPQAGSLE